MDQLITILEMIRAGARDENSEWLDIQQPVDLENQRRVQKMLQAYRIDLYDDPITAMHYNNLCVRIGIGFSGKKEFTLLRKCKDADFNLYEVVGSVELLQLEIKDEQQKR